MTVLNRRLGARPALKRGLVFASALVCVSVLSACTSGGETSEVGKIAKQTLSRALEGRKAIAPARVSQASIEKAKATIDGSLIVLELPKRKSSALLVEIGRNGNIVTYATSARQTVSLENGLLRATRGLSGDLMSADHGALPQFIASRRGGQTTKVLRFLTGEDVTQRLSFGCSVTVVPGGSHTLEFKETCVENGGATQFSNSYVADSSGRVISSHQWAGKFIQTAIIKRIQ